MVARLSGGALVAAVLTEPTRAAALNAAGWTDLITAARAEQLIGSLAWRTAGVPLSPTRERQMADARDAASEWRRTALWEAEAVRRVLAPMGVPLVLLKGTAFVAAGLSAGQGRAIGDLDLLVPRDALDAVERALLGAGWEWVKTNAYDDAYYRAWMHELPPLLHAERDRMIDVHHTILPPTARINPNAAALIDAARPLETMPGLSVLENEDIVIHAALHLFADGDLAGGLRNLWDIDRLLRQFAEDDRDFWLLLATRAAEHGAEVPVARALRLAHAIFATPVPAQQRRLTAPDRIFRRRLLARDGWGRETRAGTRLAFYVRSHWIRMPAPLLARHLAIKAWRRVGSSGAAGPR